MMRKKLLPLLFSVSYEYDARNLLTRVSEEKLKELRSFIRSLDKQSKGLIP